MRQEYITGKGETKMIRVSKPAAKKLYQAGKMVRCAMIYDRVTRISDTAEIVGDFEKCVNEALYYSACKERGNYLKFYVEC